MRIAVASGKGGTGKTSMVAALTVVAQTPLHVLDCDVEAPNSHLLLPLISQGTEDVRVPMPEFDPDLCGGCGQCVQFCASHALVQLGRVPLLLPELCHSCGGCVRLCPHQAIREMPHHVGVVETLAFSGRSDVTVFQGRLDVGVAMVSPVIRAVKHQVDGSDRTVLIDSPPGTACATATTLNGADAVLLVAEESRFGLHDLTLAVALVRQMHLPFAVLINRTATGRRKVRHWCRRQNIPVLAEIPEDKAVAQGYARGRMILDVLPEMWPVFAGVWQKLLHLPETVMA